jgi:hypothetical protein
MTAVAPINMNHPNDSDQANNVSPEDAADLLNVSKTKDETVLSLINTDQHHFGGTSTNVNNNGGETKAATPAMENGETDRKRPRIYYLDKLRTALTLLVVLHHCFWLVFAGWNPSFARGLSMEQQRLSAGWC